MKGFAVILAACLFIMNTGDLLESLLERGDVPAMEYCSDQGCSCCHKEDQPEEPSKSCEDHEDCGPACHCSCGMHLSALAYEFTEPEGVAVQTYHYGNYVNTYTFEYSGDFLQPPRKV